MMAEWVIAMRPGELPRTPRGIWLVAGAQIRTVTLDAAVPDETTAYVHAGLELAERLGRSEASVEVPGTIAGMPAIKDLVADGVSVQAIVTPNAEQFVRAASSVLAGLETRRFLGRPVDDVSAVLSFPLSALEAAVDGLLPAQSPLRERTGAAVAQLLDHAHGLRFKGLRWESLEEIGALTPVLRWESRDGSTADPVSAKEIAPRDARATLQALADEGIDVEAVGLGLPLRRVGTLYRAMPEGA